MIAKSDDKYHNKGISKNAFKKDVLGKVQGPHLGMLRGGQKFITRNEMKHSVKELTEFLKAHPKFTANRHALEKIGVRAYEGSKLRQDFNNAEFLKKVDRYAVGQQSEQEKSKDTGPTPEELKRQERRKQANILIGRSQRLRAEDAAGKPSGFAAKLATTTDTSGRAPGAASSATTRKGVQTSVAGDTRTAGQPQPGVPIPGQPNSATGPARSAVQLAGLGGLGRVGAGRSVPAVGAPDTRGTAPAPNESPAAAGTSGGLAGKYAAEQGAGSPTPAGDTEVTDLRPAKSTDDTDDEDIDRNLPLAA